MRWKVLIASVAALGALVMVVHPEGSFAVEGTLILWDDYPGKSGGERCTGERSLYHDINASTRVTVKTADGRDVAGASLGSGHIASAADLADLSRVSGRQATADEVAALLADVGLIPCLFSFRFDVDAGADGGDGYVVVLGRRGQVAMSESDLRKPGAVQLSVGLR